MELQRGTFAPEQVERRGTGAGVIPVAVDPDGRTHLLLGRERWSPAWRGSCRWSGFEGSRKEGETLLDTAVREFTEESMSVLLPHVRAVLQSRQYWRRVVLRIANERQAERYHATYVIPVEWDPTLSITFDTMRQRVEHVDRLVQEWRHLRPACLGDATEHIGVVREEEDGTAYVEKLVSTAPCILRVPWTVDAARPDVLCATFRAVDATQVLQWSVLRDRIGRALLDNHPATRVVRDAVWGMVQNVHILRDHLEKDQVRWWSLHDLARVMETHGSFGNDRFRPYFLPVLQTILSEFEEVARPPHEPSGSDP